MILVPSVRLAPPPMPAPSRRCRASTSSMAWAGAGRAERVSGPSTTARPTWPSSMKKIGSWGSASCNTATSGRTCRCWASRRSIANAGWRHCCCHGWRSPPLVAGIERIQLEAQVGQRRRTGVLRQPGLPADRHSARLLPRHPGCRAAGKAAVAEPGMLSARAGGPRRIPAPTGSCDIPYTGSGRLFPAAQRRDRGPASPFRIFKLIPNGPFAPATDFICCWPPPVVACLLAACGQQGSAQPAAPPPPPEVGVVTVAPGDVGLVTELPGRLEASRVAQVRARAAGIVQKRLFREGSDVRAGQALFRIDPAPYAAAHGQRPGARWRARRPTWARPRRWPSATSRWSKPTPSASRNTPTRVRRAEAGRGRRGRRRARRCRRRRSTSATPRSRRRSPAASAARW